MIEKYDFFLQKSRKSILVVASILCTFGIYSVIQGKKELIPKTEYRKYNLEIFYPNASPSTVDTIITQPIVSGLLSKKEVHTIYSHSTYGISKINFELHQDNMYIVQDYLDKLYESFPREVKSSKIKEVIYGEKSILKIMIPLENNYLLSVIQKELSTLGGIVMEVEGTIGSISLEYDEKRLSHSGIPKRELREILKQETKKSPVGIGIESGRLLPIQSQGLLSNGIESSLSTLKPSIKSLITIEKKDEFHILYDGKKVILVSIYPITSEFSPFVVRELKKILQQIRIEKGLEYKIIYDKYEEILNIVHDFILGIGFVFICGTFLVSLIINDKRIISLVFLILVISILLIFLVHFVLEISLNIYSLMGISMGVGLLFDIANTIFITIQSNKNNKSISQNLKSIYKSSFYSTLTSIVVLIPLLNLQSRIATMYNSISISFIITLSINIIVTYTIVLLFGSKYVGSPKSYNFSLFAEFHLHLPLKFLIHKNWKLKKSLLQSRSLLCCFLFLIIALGCSSLFLLSKEIYPPLGEKQIRITFSPNGTQDNDFNDRFIEFDEILSKQPKILHRIGKRNKETLEWFVEFSGNDSKEFIEEIHKAMHMKRGILEFENLQSFTDDTQSISLLLLIFKEENVTQIRKNLENYKESKKVLQIHTGSINPYEIYTPKSERFFLSSLQNDEFSDFHTDLSTFQISYYDEKTGTKQTINLDKQMEREKTDSMVWRGIPAREYFQKNLESIEPPIYSKNGRRYYPLYLQVSRDNESEIRKALEKYFKSGDLEESHDKDSEKIIGELLSSLCYSILYLFILLFFAYESFSKSIFVLSTLIFVDSFAFIGLYVSGASLNSGSFLGILFLSGISVDSIILFLEKKSQSLQSIYKIVIVNLFTTLLGMISLLVVFGTKQFQSTIALSVLSGLLGLFIYFSYLAKPIYKLFVRTHHTIWSPNQTGKILISKKRLFILRFLLVIVLLFSSSRTSFRSIPETLPKGVKIEWVFPMGAQAVLEQKVAQPIETILSKLDGIEGSETHIEYGYLRIQIKFKENANHKNLTFYLHKELSELQKQFPPEYPKVHISSLVPEEEPDIIFSIKIESLTKEDQILFLKKEVIPKLKTLWGVRHISLFGESHLETKIQYDRKKLTNANISPPDFITNVSKYLEVSHTDYNQKILNPIKVLAPSSLQMGFVVLKGKLFFQDFMKAYIENKSKNILHRLNAEESLGVTIHLDSLTSSLYFYIGLQFLHLPKNLEIQTIYHSFQNISSIFLKNINYLFVPFLLYILLTYNKEKSSKNILYIFMNSFFSFLFVVIIYKYIDLAIIYGMGISFLILFISSPTKDSFPHLKWTLLLLSIYLIVVLFPIEYKELYFSAIYCTFLFLNLFWIFITYKGESSPIKSLLVRYFFYTFHKKTKFIKKLGSTFKPLGTWISPTWISEYNLKNILFCFILMIVSIVYFFFPGLPPIFLPSLHGKVLIGNLDLPTGSPMSTTNILSQKVEMNLVQSNYFEKVYVKILNERAKFYLQLKEGNLPDKSYMRTISGLGSPGYFYFPSESFHESEVLEVDFYGDDVIQIWNSIQKFQTELQKKSSDIEIIYKFKIPSQRLDLVSIPSRFIVSGIYPSLLSTILNTNSGIISRIYTNEKLMDIKLEEESHTNDRSKYLNEFSSFKMKQYLPSHYFQPKPKEDFSIIRKVNGQLVLSILLLEKEQKKRPFFSILNTLESSYLYSTTNPILETLQKQNPVKTKIQTKKKSITTSVLCICIALVFLFYSNQNKV